MTGDVYEQWVRERSSLYEDELELEHRRAELSKRRQALPRVEVTKDYEFDTEVGPRSLTDLFDGRSQLVIYHFMTPPDSGEFCRSCSFWLDNVGHLAHLHARDTSLVVDCLAPLSKSLKFRERMGWTMPWVSSGATSFYDDLHVDLPEETYERVRELIPHIPLGQRVAPGISAFVLEGDRPFLTYSSFTFTEDVNSIYGYLDFTAKGRQEADLAFHHQWVRYHDEYFAVRTS